MNVILQVQSNLLLSASSAALDDLSSLWAFGDVFQEYFVTALVAERVASKH